ncbi:MAG: antitoxin [Candidatus Brocadia sp. WS118]|nr:MAG: antitoxin [Candidatus Brocadia sp. WS118]
MELIKDYIVDETGKVKKVVLDYDTFKKLEGLMLDLGLAKAMEEVKDDEELSLEETKVLLGNN